MSKAHKRSNLYHLNRLGHNSQQAYRFQEPDNLLSLVLAAIDQSGKSDTWIAEKSGVSRSTLSRWRLNPHTRAQAVTMRYVLRAIGKTLSITDLPDLPTGRSA